MSPQMDAGLPQMSAEFLDDSELANSFITDFRVNLRVISVNLRLIQEAAHGQRH